MKKTLVSVLVGLVVGFAVSEFRHQGREAASSAVTASALAATLGDAVAMYVEPGLDNAAKGSLLKLIRDQSMILISLNLDPTEMDAKGFSGLCRLVSSSPSLFTIHSQESVDGIAEQLLRTQLSSRREAIANESLKRGQRSGDEHRCPGFK